MTVGGGQKAGEEKFLYHEDRIWKTILVSILLEV